jgi:hypothetical protein
MTTPQITLVRGLDGTRKRVRCNAAYLAGTSQTVTLIGVTHFRMAKFSAAAPLRCIARTCRGCTTILSQHSAVKRAATSSRLKFSVRASVERYTHKQHSAVYTYTLSAFMLKVLSRSTLCALRSTAVRMPTAVQAGCNRYSSCCVAYV